MVLSLTPFMRVDSSEYNSRWGYFLSNEGPKIAGFKYPAGQRVISLEMNSILKRVVDWDDPTIKIFIYLHS